MADLIITIYNNSVKLPQSISYVRVQEEDKDPSEPIPIVVDGSQVSAVIAGNEKSVEEWLNQFNHSIVLKEDIDSLFD